MTNGTTNRWCILRTSGGQTLALADYLLRVGIEAWTPRRVFRQVIRKGKKNERTVDAAAPILPTFVFARAVHLVELADLAARDTFSRPAFSIFTHGGRIPEVRDHDVAGLREGEEAAAEALRHQRDAETREEAEAIRIAALKTERERQAARRRAEHERRMALRAETRDFKPGAEVSVAEMPALTGVIGTVVENNGRTALINFGGSFAWEIEAWRLSPYDVYASPA